MTPPRAITIRLAEPRDAQAIGMMSRDFVEAGLGWKYDAARVLRAIRDRETLAVVACESGKSSTSRGAVTGFAIMEFGDERAHLVLLAVRPSHRRLGIGQRLLEWMLESARCAGMSSIHLELRASNDAARRFYRAMGFYETVLVPGYYRSGEGRKEGALRMLRVLRARGPVDIAAVGCDVGIVGGVEILVQMRRELEAVSIAQAPVPLGPDEQRVDGARAISVLAVRLVLRAEARGVDPGLVAGALPFP